ncbi:hypothetical protein [Streptosporangium sp. LJ11]|uniref:hypothetical protein n=1 Tax=Streptosporangium sp. LJ11 TaxID=3436927 RepID=UPI003F7A434D
MIGYRVQEYTGIIVARGEQRIYASTIKALDRSAFPMLGHIDPYDDTMFNSLQVRTLVEELDRLPNDHPLNSSDCSDLKALCELVVGRIHHRQLWFIGD